MAELRFTILGCGSSGGVPRIGGHWGACDPDNPKNLRLRCSLLVERETSGGTTSVLIDTSPDMRQQLIAAKVGHLDAAVFTHSHADHVHGIDDLRMVVFNRRSKLPVWADLATQEDLYSRFGYAFHQPDGSPYPPILEMNTIGGPFSVSGAGGDITFEPIQVAHGTIDALGFRVRNLAYLPDVSEIYPKAWEQLRDLDCWILDALRRSTHPSHANLDQALAWIEQAAPNRAVLTDMHIDLDYSTVDAETPDHVTPAYDGMVLRYDD